MFSAFNVYTSVLYEWVLYFLLLNTTFHQSIQYTTLTVNDLVQRYLIHMLQNTNDLNTQIYSDSLISKNSTNSAADAFAHTATLNAVCLWACKNAKVNGVNIDYAHYQYLELQNHNNKTQNFLKIATFKGSKIQGFHSNHMNHVIRKLSHRYDDEVSDGCYHICSKVKWNV